MASVLIVYIILLLVFFFFTGLILRHTHRYGHLSEWFKVALIVFGILSVIIIIVSFYFLIQLYTVNPSAPALAPLPSQGNNINF